MWSDPLFLLVAVVCIGVVLILAVGIGAFAKGGEFHKKNSNKLMRYRIGAQFIAVLLILLFIIIRGGN